MTMELMHIGPSSLVSNEKATTNLISTMLLMIIFTGVLLSAISFAIPMLGKAVAVADMQKAKDVLSSLDETIRTDAQGTLEYRLSHGYLSGNKQEIDVQINYSSNNSIYSTTNLNGCTIHYMPTEEFPCPSIRYTPETSLQNGGLLRLSLSEIDCDLVPQPGYHRISFSSYQENSSHTGNFTVHINYHQYNRSRYYSNISRVDFEIKKISVWDEEWRG
ncbi:MAG TPA: hypothetical protein C5S50_10825 [Methanosarcinaceae archaeon]|nr:hypothetical protein [Methanosarcinaceae archaeon]